MQQENVAQAGAGHLLGATARRAVYGLDKGFTVIPSEGGSGTSAGRPGAETTGVARFFGDVPSDAPHEHVAVGNSICFCLENDHQYALCCYPQAAAGMHRFAQTPLKDPTTGEDWDNWNYRKYLSTHGMAEADAAAVNLMPIGPPDVDAAFAYQGAWTGVADRPEGRGPANASRFLFVPRTAPGAGIGCSPLNGAKAGGRNHPDFIKVYPIIFGTPIVAIDAQTRNQYAGPWNPATRQFDAAPVGFGGRWSGNRGGGAEVSLTAIGDVSVRTVALGDGEEPSSWMLARSDGSDLVGWMNPNWMRDDLFLPPWKPGHLDSDGAFGRNNNLPGRLNVGDPNSGYPAQPCRKENLQAFESIVMPPGATAPGWNGFDFEVSYKGTRRVVFRLAVVDTPNAAGLADAGGGKLQTTPGSGPFRVLDTDTAVATLQAGFLKGSNIDETDNVISANVSAASVSSVVSCLGSALESVKEIARAGR
jgi:hypothetical protein